MFVSKATVMMVFHRPALGQLSNSFAVYLLVFRVNSTCWHGGCTSLHASVLWALFHCCICQMHRLIPGFCKSHQGYTYTAGKHFLQVAHLPISMVTVTNETYSDLRTAVYS